MSFLCLNCSNKRAECEKKERESESDRENAKQYKYKWIHNLIIISTNYLWRVNSQNEIKINKLNNFFNLNKVSIINEWENLRERENKQH